jgi:DNA-directed RNA polymerase specialized sigma24 family protein
MADNAMSRDDYERLRRYIRVQGHRYARGSRLFRIQEGDDVADQIIERLWDKYRSRKRSAPFAAWLFDRKNIRLTQRMVRHTLINQTRHQETGERVRRMYKPPVSADYSVPQFAHPLDVRVAEYVVNHGNQRGLTKTLGITEYQMRQSFQRIGDQLR